MINEGNFQDADGSISFINPDDGSVKQDLFGSVNNGLALGDVVQSMTIDDDFAYVVVNNSNKIEVVNANTFVSEHTIQGLSLPRYFTTLNGKGYVTEWVNYSDPGRVTIIDIETTRQESLSQQVTAQKIFSLTMGCYMCQTTSRIPFRLLIQLKKKLSKQSRSVVAPEHYC